MDLGVDRAAMEDLFKNLLAEIPEIVREQLEICGFTNGLSVIIAPDDWISSIENHMRKILKDQSIDVLRKYGGELSTTAENFSIPPGHANLLNFIRNKLKETGYEPNYKRNLRKFQKLPQSKQFQIMRCKDEYNRKLVDLVATFLRKKNIYESPKLTVRYILNRLGEKALIGTIVCVFCQKSITVHFDIKTRQNGRWIISNYASHIGGHLNLVNKKMIDQKSIANYLTEMPTSEDLSSVSEVKEEIDEEFHSPYDEESIELSETSGAVFEIVTDD